MILDRLIHADRYRGLGGRVAEALDYLRRTDFSSLAAGRYELDGDRLVAIVQRYRTKPMTDVVWEAHRRFIDVQYVATGSERMGYVPLDDALPVRTPYNEAKDCVLFDAQGDLFSVPAGSFAVFGPQDVHAPSLVGADNLPGDVLKVVVKCAVEP